MEKDNPKIEIIEAINIKDYKEFIKIEGSYGSYQKWLFSQGFKTRFWSNRSCGIAAAGNLAYYLTKHHGKNLYSGDYLDIKSFTLFLNRISKFIRPRIYGIPTLYHMRKGFTKFASARGQGIETKTISMRRSDEEVINYIKNGLRDNYPILMLTWNTQIKHLKYHWVTITGYFKDENGVNYIRTSNWGRLEIFNLDEWISQKSVYKGLIYFK